MDTPQNTNQITVQPVGGAVVRFPAGHPKQYEAIPAGGATVPAGAYWTRAINRGDLALVNPERRKQGATTFTPAELSRSALKNMKKDELEKLAAERGLEISGEVKKTELVEMLAPGSED